MPSANIGRLVYGAREPKAGAIDSAMRAHEHPALNHRIEACGGVLEAECRGLIQALASQSSPLVQTLRNY